MKEILRVAVVHDIGKLNITADVIENSVRDSESEAYLVRCCESEKKMNGILPGKFFRKREGHMIEQLLLWKSRFLLKFPKKQFAPPFPENG
jgi:hypothetical protein